MIHEYAMDIHDTDMLVDFFSGYEDLLRGFFNYDMWVSNQMAIDSPSCGPPNVTVSSG